MLEILEDLAGMELFHPGVVADARSNNLLALELRQVLLNFLAAVSLPGGIRLGASISLGFNSHDTHATEKYLEDGLHIVDKHALEVVFLDGGALYLLPGYR